MNAVVKYENTQHLSLNETMSLGDVFKNSGYFKDVRDQAQAVVKILYGRELGFSPVVSMMGIHVIEGKPALSANLMGAMVKRSGKYDYRVVDLSDNGCALQFFQDGQPVGKSTFTMEDAQKAQVVRQGSGWTKYPRNMLFARALSNGVKLFCPELSACPIYVPEELGAEVNEEGSVISAPASVPVPADTNVVKRSFRQNAEKPSDGQEVKVEVVNDDHAGTEGKGPDAPAPVETVSTEPVQYITAGQQSNFHKECRAAVRPRRSMEADTLTYQWLKDNKYVDEKGEGTAAKILAAGWLETRRMAVAWLKVQ